MALPIWPLTKRVMQSGFTYTFADGRLKTAMENGPPKSRRRFSAAVRLVSAQYEGTLAEMTALETFWDVDTVGGSLPFQMPDQMRVAAPAWTVMFGDSPPQVSSVGGDAYRASFSLVIMP